MRKNLSHIAKAVGTLTLLIVALAFAYDGHAETTASEKKELERPVLSMATIDAMRSAIENHFILPGNLTDAASVRLRIRVHFDNNGRVSGSPEVEASGGSERTKNIITKAALRAILGAAPYAMLPKDKYDAWKEVILNFDASQLNR